MSQKNPEMFLFATRLPKRKMGGLVLGESTTWQLGILSELSQWFRAGTKKWSVFVPWFLTVKHILHVHIYIHLQDVTLTWHEITVSILQDVIINNINKLHLSINTTVQIYISRFIWIQCRPSQLKFPKPQPQFVGPPMMPTLSRLFGCSLVLVATAPHPQSTTSPRVSGESMIFHMKSWLVN